MMQSKFLGVIPWFSETVSLRYCGNEQYFEEMFREKTIGCNNSKIQPYILNDPENGNSVLGGLIHFSLSPEKFGTDYNNYFLEELEKDQSFSYITGFLLRDVFQKSFVGIIMFHKALSDIFQEHHKIWGVVSEKSLLPYYQEFGFKIVNPKTRENFFIITCSKNDHQKSLLF